MFTSWKTFILTNMLLAVAGDTTTEPSAGSESVGSTSGQFSCQDVRVSEIWIRKMRTYFRFLDFDGDGVVRREEFDGMATRVADLENFDPAQRMIARQHLSDLFSLYTAAAGTRDDVFMTEDLLIESVKMGRDDPSFKKILFEALLSLFAPIKVNEKGYFNYDELRILFEDLGFVDTDFLQEAFVAINTNHDGKVSLLEYFVAAGDYMCSDDEKTTALFGLRF